MQRGGRVRQLNLTLGVESDEPREIAEIRRLAEERFIRGVLDEGERVVRRTLGEDTLVFVRKLEAHFRVRQDELDSPSAQASFGGEFGEAVLARIRALPRSARRLPRHSDELAVFEDEAHLRAAYLSLALDGDHDAWFFAGLRDEAGVWETACEAGPTMLAPVLSWLSTLETLERVLAMLGPGRVDRAAQVVPHAAFRHARAAVGSPASVARAASAESTRAGAPAQSTEAAAPEDGRTSREVEASASSVPAQVGTAPAAGDAGAEPAAVLRHTSKPEQAGSSTAGEARANAPGTDSAPRPWRARAQPDAQDAGRYEDPSAALPAFATRFAGLFYLVRTIIEIDLAEHLYYAGLFEGSFIAHAAALLVSEQDDPAPWLLGGARDAHPPVLAPVADWAADEIWRQARASVAERLRARELVCPLDDELSEQIDALCAAPRALAEARGHDPRTAQLLARAIVLVAYTMQARLAEPCDFAGLAARLARAGTVSVSPEELRVMLPMSAVDLELRRAGLDFDPGFVPWLRRSVRFTFEGEEQ